MRSLAKHRRSRFAPLVLVLFGLIVMGGAYGLVMPVQPSAAVKTDADSLAEGKAIFQANCATCHGSDAAGTDAGPSLIGVGAASVHFQMATGRMPMANNSPQAERKTPQFNEDQIADVAGWIGSLAPGPAIPSAEQVDPKRGNAARGMQLFRTNCAMCHNAVGAGGALSEGKYAPNLLDSTPTEIYEAMMTGPQSMPVFNDANIDEQGKRDIIAYLDAQKDTSAGGLNLGSIGPVAEGLWIWVVGMGGLILIAVWIGAKSK